MSVEFPALVRSGALALVATCAFVGYRGVQLARAGWVEGQVEHVYAEPVRCGYRRNRKTCFDFHAVVGYQVAGASYRATEPAGRATEATWRITDASLRAGDRVWVAFDAANPADHYQDGWRVVPTTAIAVLIGGAVLVAVGVRGIPERPRNHQTDDEPTTLGLSGRNT